jgi:hypothetical protein
MKSKLFLAALLASASPALAQNTLDNTSSSGSDATAVSGSASGAESNGNVQGQSQYGGNNAGIGSSTSASDSNAVAVTSSESGSTSNSDQGQSQGQNSANTNQLGAMNQQGVQVATTFNTTNRKQTEVRTNAAVPLAASSSFSSDYCGGTASGGASVAPLGISIGGAAPTFDDSCRYLRVAEKAGMLGANYHNMRQYDMAGRAMSMMAWSLCMAGPQQDNRRRGNKDNATIVACIALGLLGSDMSPTPHSTQQEVTPMHTQKQNTTPPTDPYKTPRGDLEFHNIPVIQDLSFNDTAKAAMPPRP